MYLFEQKKNLTKQIDHSTNEKNDDKIIEINEGDQSITFISDLKILDMINKIGTIVVGLSKNLPQPTVSPDMLARAQELQQVVQQQLQQSLKQVPSQQPQASQAQAQAPVSANNGSGSSVTEQQKLLAQRALQQLQLIQQFNPHLQHLTPQQLQLQLRQMVQQQLLQQPQS